MMKDKDKTKEQLINELVELRQRVAELRAADAERMWVEGALRESEERFQQVAENAQEWIWEVDTHGLYTYASPIVEKILGYKPEEVVGKKHFYDLFHPEDREELKRAAFEAFAQKQPFREFVNRNVRQDGGTVWLSTSGVPVFDEEGNLLGYRGADTDITERRQAERALEQRASQLATVGEIGRQIVSILEPDELLNQIVNLLEDAFGYRYVYIFLLDEDSRELVLRAGAGATGRVLEGTRIAVEARSINACVARTGRPLVANDVSNQPTYLRLEKVADTRSELAVPIKVKDQVIGTLDVQSMELNAFDESDLFTLQALASQAGIAIENARLYEEAQQRIGELSGLHEISQAFSSMTDVRETYGELTRRMVRLIGCQMCTIATYDHRTREIRAQPPGYGAPDELVQSLCYKVDGPVRDAWNFRLQGPLLVNDVAQIPDFFSQWVEGFDLFNLLIVPMTHEGRITGLVYAANKPGGFAGDDSKLLTIFAGQAAVIIEDARLYEETKRWAEEMTSVYNISVATTSTLSLDEVLRSVCDQVSRLMDVSSFYIALYDADRKELSFELALDEGAPVGKFTRKIANGAGLSGWIVQSKQPLLIKNAEREELPAGAIVVGLPTRSWLGVPLLYRDQVVGVMGVQSYQPHAFDEDDQRLLSTIAAQVAIAIENARLFAETKRRANGLALLLDTSTAISSTLNLDQILETVAQQITTALVATFCRISLLDEAGENMVVIRAASPVRGQGAEDSLGRRCPLDVIPWHRQVIETGQPVILRQDMPELALSDEEREMALSKEVRSAALIPLIVGGRVLGVISLGEERSWERSPFSPEKVELCQSIARQAAVAIENAHLYEETQQRLQELAILMESGATVVSAFDLKELLGKVAELMALSIGVEACGISSWKKGEGVVCTLAEYSSAGRVVEGGGAYRLDDYPATAQLLYSGQPFQVRADDPTADERERIFLAEWPMKSLLALPIAGESGVVGLLELYDSERTRTFSPEEIARGQAWAEQMASFVEKVPTLRREGEKEFSRALRQLAVRAMHDLDLAWCVMSRWDRAGERVVTLAECGDVIWPREAGASYRLADYPATARVLYRRQALVVRLDDPTADERERALLEEGGWGAMLALPMLVRDEVIGLAEFFDRRARTFTTAEIELSQTLANQAAIALENAWAQEELQRSFEKLQRTLEGTVNALVSAIEMKDRYTAGHQRRVAQLACAIASEMDLPEEQIEGLRMAGLIHDLGKINVPAEILSKPGRLNDIEYGLVKAHSETGYDVLKTIDFPWPVAQIVLQHHERMDGSGYPQGLSGDEILLEAKILAVADVVEAMASFRPYRPTLGIDKALEEISQNGGILYDPEVVGVCLKLFTEEGFEFE